MRKFTNKKIIFITILSLLISNVIFGLTGCSNKKSGFEIALITDVGQLLDAGFNQGTWEGVLHYATLKNKTYQYYIPANGDNTQDEDRVQAMEEAIKNGAKILIIPGFAQSRAITKVATEHPDIKFVYVDGWSLGLPNVTAIVYKEEEAGFFAGYAAVKDGYRKMGGIFGGGGTNPACNRYGYGYLQGIEKAAKESQKKVTVKYSYQYGEAFNSSDALAKKMEGWYNDGVEVVFACGGSMLYSVIQAAEKDEDAKIIGVDVDQSKINGRIIMSAMKGLAVSVEKILDMYYQGEWDKTLAYKEYKLGVADNATGIPYASSKFKRFRKAQYDSITKDVIDGKIIIDAKVPTNCNDEKWLIERFGNSDYIDIIFEKENEEEVAEDDD